MISTIPVALGAAPATAAIALAGLAPVFWTTVGLVATAAALVVRDLRTTPATAAAGTRTRPAPLRPLRRTTDRFCDAT